MWTKENQGAYNISYSDILVGKERNTENRRNKYQLFSSFFFSLISHTHSVSFELRTASSTPLLWGEETTFELEVSLPKLKSRVFSA
jgi:hypothetical protein